MKVEINEKGEVVRVVCEVGENLNDYFDGADWLDCTTYEEEWYGKRSYIRGLKDIDS